MTLSALQVRALRSVRSSASQADRGRLRGPPPAPASTPIPHPMRGPHRPVRAGTQPPQACRDWHSARLSTAVDNTSIAALEGPQGRRRGRSHPSPGPSRPARNSCCRRTGDGWVRGSEGSLFVSLAARCSGRRRASASPRVASRGDLSLVRRWRARPAEGRPSRRRSRLPRWARRAGPDQSLCPRWGAVLGSPARGSGPGGTPDDPPGARADAVDHGVGGADIEHVACDHRARDRAAGQGGSEDRK